MLALVEHKNIDLSREQLLWGFDFAWRTRTVDMHIAQLGDKLEARALAIETVWGMGYKLVV